MQNKKAFTLIELIIVIAIIAILAGAIFVAIDPARRLHESRNAIRASDVSTILDAIKKYQSDNEGAHYSELSGLGDEYYYMIGTGAACTTTCEHDTTNSSCVDLSEIGSNYLADVPIDPKDGTTAKTGYYVNIDENNSVSVRACYPEGEGTGGAGDPPIIKATR